LAAPVVEAKPERSPDSEAAEPTVESVRAEIVRDIEADRGRLPPRLEMGPPRILESAVPFVQRYGYEVVLARARERFDQGWSSYGFLGDIFPTREWWTVAEAKAYLGKISSLQLDLDDVVGTSLFTKWRELEPSLPDDADKPLRMMEIADAVATKMGLTIRQKSKGFAALPREKMALGIDPTRQIEQPENIGVLQLASLFGERARRSTDTFFVVDIWNWAPEQFGGGKSQLLLQLLAEVSAYLRHVLDPPPQPFDFRHDCVYSADHGRLRRFLGDRTPNVARGVDEMDQFAYKRTSQVGAQKATIAVWKRNRKWGQVWGGCSPSLWELDEFLREIKVTHRVRIREWDADKREGHAEVFAKGGPKNEATDEWGHFLMDFDFRSLPNEMYLAYKDLVAYVEDHPSETKSALDAYLKAHPDHLADVVPKPSLDPLAAFDRDLALLDPVRPPDRGDVAT